MAISGNTRDNSTGSIDHDAPSSLRVADNRPALMARRIELFAMPVAFAAVPSVKDAMVRTVRNDGPAQQVQTIR